MNEFRLLPNEHVDGSDVTIGSGVVHGMAGAGRGDLALQFAAQHVGDPAVAPVQGHLEQRFLGERSVEDVGASVDEQAHGVDVAFADGEVKWRHVPELRLDQRRVGVEHPAKPGGVAVTGGVEDLPDVLTPPPARPVQLVGRQFVGPQQRGRWHSVRPTDDHVC